MQIFDEPSAAEPVEAKSNAPVVFSAAEPEGAAFDFSAPTHAIGELPDESAHRPLRSVPVPTKSTGKQGGNEWLIPAICVLVLGGAVGWFVWQQYQTDRLVGELTAESAPTLELPATEASSGTLKQSPEEMKGILESLEKSPVRLPSALMQVQIGATKRGLTFSVSAGVQTQFYRVDTAKDQPLAKYRKSHSFELDQRRTDEIERSGTAFIDEYQKVREKKAGANALSEFRNTLALPALVGAIGNQVVAVQGNTIYRCVYEDREGGLYFLMPPGVQSFEIIPKSDKDSRALLSCKYLVKVTGERAVPEKAKPADEKKEKKKESMEDEEKAEMKESMEEGEAKPKMEKMEKSQ